MTAPLHRFLVPNSQPSGLGQLLFVMRGLNALLHLARRAHGAGRFAADFDPASAPLTLDLWQRAVSAGEALADEADLLGQAFWRDLGRLDMPDHRGRPVGDLRPSHTAEAVAGLAALFEDLIVLPARALLAAAGQDAERRDHCVLELLSGRAHATMRLPDNAAGVLPGPRPATDKTPIERKSK